MPECAHAELRNATLLHLTRLLADLDRTSAQGYLKEAAQGDTVTISIYALEQ